MNIEKSFNTTVTISCKIVSKDDAVAGGEEGIIYTHTGSELGGIEAMGIAFESNYGKNEPTDNPVIPKSPFIKLAKDEGFISNDDIFELLKSVFANTSIDNEEVSVESIFEEGFVFFRPLLITDDGEEQLLDPEEKIPFSMAQVISVESNDPAEIVEGIMDKNGKQYLITVTGDVDLGPTLESRTHSITGFRTPIVTDHVFYGDEINELVGTPLFTSDQKVDHFGDLLPEAKKGWTPLGIPTGAVGGTWVTGAEDREGYSFSKTDVSLEINGGDSQKVISNFVSILGAPWRALAGQNRTEGYGDTQGIYYDIRAKNVNASKALTNHLYYNFGAGLTRNCDNITIKNIHLKDVDIASSGKASSALASFLNGNATLENFKINGKVRAQDTQCWDSGGLFGDIRSGASLNFKNVEIDLQIRTTRYGSGFIGGVMRGNAEEDRKTHIFDGVTIKGYNNHMVMHGNEMSGGGAGWHGQVNGSAFIGVVGGGNTIHLKDFNLEASYSYFRGDYGTGSSLLTKLGGVKDAPVILTMDSVDFSGDSLRDWDTSDGWRSTCVRIPDHVPTPNATGTYAGWSNSEYESFKECWPNNPGNIENPSKLDPPSNNGVYPYDPLVATTAERESRKPGYKTNSASSDALAADRCRRTCETGVGLIFGSASWSLIVVAEEDGRGLSFDGVDVHIEELFDYGYMGNWQKDVFINGEGPFYPHESHAAVSSSDGTAQEVSLPNATYKVWKPSKFAFVDSNGASATAENVMTGDFIGTFDDGVAERSWALNPVVIKYAPANELRNF